jgi:hypothetical protein
MGTVVVVTTHALSSQDAAELLDIAGGDGAQFHVAVPEQASSESMDSVMGDWELAMASGRGAAPVTADQLAEHFGDDAARVASEVLELSLQALRATGATADGEVTPHHPLESIGDIVAHRSPDEVVVMVRHKNLSSATGRDLAGKIQRKFGVDTIRVKAH